MPGEGRDHIEEDREALLAVDRATEAMPLPYADRTHYQSDVERQVDLAAAERSNVAAAAGELGITTDEYNRMREELGRSPGRGDVPRAQ